MSPPPKLFRISLKSPENAVNSAQLVQNRLEMSHNAFNRLFSPYIQLKSTRITSKLSLLVSTHQNFISKLQQMLSIVPLGHKFNTTRPQIAVKLLSVVSSLSASSPNTTQRPQSSQIVPKSNQLDANHRKMPSTHRNIAFNSFCDIIECLISHSRVPKSAPIITKWSQIIRSAPSIPLLRYHSMSHSPHTHSQLL